MGFTVEPSAVEALSGQFGRLNEDAAQGKSYVSNNTDINWTGEGLINLITGGHRNVQQQVEDFLNRLDDPISSDAHTALSEAAKYYRSTDQQHAEKLDSTYPASDVDKAKQGAEQVDAKVGAFKDVAEPAENYTPPKDYNSEFPYEPNWKDIISPSTLLRDAIYKVTELGATLGVCDRAYDPFEVILKPLCGDWAGMRASADVFENVGKAATDMSTNLRWSAQHLADSWTGNAADSCHVYMLDLAKSLQAAQQPLNKIAGEYKSAAKGANELSGAIGVLISDIADAAIAAAASGAISAAAGSTGVGLPIALAVGAFTLTRVYKVCKGVYDIIDLLVRIQATMSTFNSTANDMGRVDANAQLPQLAGGTPTLPS